jgi:hypothetical protein
MARFRSNKRREGAAAQGEARGEGSTPARRREKAAEGVDDDIDWNQAVGIDPPPGAVTSEDDEDAADSDEDLADEDDANG